MKILHSVLGAMSLALALGVTSGPVEARDFPPPPAVPTAIALPGNYEVQAAFAASGVQIYRCLPSATVAGSYAWSFIAPEATLFNARGRVAGHHFAGPTWQAMDGSKVVGTVLARAASTLPATIPWLLLSAVVTQPGETFEHVVYVQRLNTSGGAAPATGCTADTSDTEIRVPYTADYYFYSND
jgi:hypothetical protein